ncbi:trehalose-phosphatase [Paraconexibacter algicola]|uniref:trehalose-phosphatase n=1 Tax=Paraconexibacter algicola TaxID=2133960 RepID=UPI001E3718F9|nr:trehalose-phosphatase [Paraconexibacter algicola]
MPADHVLADDAALRAALAPFVDDPRRAGVLLDVDGTLAPIVRHADDAHVPEPTRLPLIAIARRFGLVACISGRRASVARRIVSLGSITYVGNHGGEVLRGGATSVDVVPEIAEWTGRVRAFAKDVWSDELLRLRIREEDKDTIAAYHWRGVPDEAAAQEAMEGVADRARAAGLATHWGRKVLEVRAPVEATKGTGIRKLLEAHDVDVALFAGDDRTDVDAFDTLRELVAEGALRAALCVGVTSDETPDELTDGADLLVDGPVGVRTVLEVLADATAA